ncbi:NADPH-dependent 2,4-dienoyl-CoA reductase/sulfur reductase-like enzyme [Nocardia transvalensis]|uniref:NADPH-dependent 2,4-dienoyl-CoA reductase/sulfur reductase-like enzyme n=1 Tax=Nocardia transvalensis TaxID=37333 RepID=A0A7W9UGE7_9NOCA|nr:FAD-dependent oxidoreductase [Nocardia transvalensis]MBB5912199.1 NADPH-dependent 2,4-dienoyl-CoA reductase/sulfur reductase-like enzyme [Nocardia transvalensis]
MRSIAVIGASLAGLSAARALRAQGFSGDLTIVGAESRRPYDRPPLSKAFLAGDIDEEALALESDDEDLQANWLLGVAATDLDTAGRSVGLSDGSRVHADGFVIATGARARRWPGAENLAGVHVLRTIEDAVRLRTDLRPGARLVVIGAGFIGGEVASTARALGLDVTIVEAAPTPLLGPLGPELGAAVADLHIGNGTVLHCGVGVAGLTGTDRVTGVDLSTGGHIPADVVVVGIGGVPNIEWLRDSGLELGNGVLCDLGGATCVPHVVAVGDCSAWFDPVSGAHRRVEHWSGALERPAIAVSTLLSGGFYQGAPVKPPYFWSDQYGSRIQFAGLAHPGDEPTVEAGDLAGNSFLAVYRRAGQPVAVLGVDQVRLFTRWRRQLSKVPTPA